MKSLPKTGFAAAAFVAALAFAAFITPTSTVEARPNYKKVFDKQYPKVKKTDCNVCHEKGTKDKKKRNEYGKAMAEALGDEEKVTNEKKIIAAFEEANKKDSKTEGKTFGDLIKAGKRPVE